MSDHQDPEGEVRYFLRIKGKHPTNLEDAIQYLMNKTDITRTAARKAINAMIRSKKLHRQGNVLSLPD